MRQTSEILKVIADSERNEQSLSKAEIKERITLPISPNDNQALEPQGFNRLQPIMQPAREAELSLVRSDPHLVTLHDIDPEAAAQYNRLAIGLITGAMKHPPLKRVLVASAHHCEGRTCVMLNLAAALARARQRVLVVDSDLLRPSVNRLLGIETETGLSEALTDALPPEAAVTRLLPIGFDVLPTRSQIENSVELLASPDFRTLLAALDNSYDFILFDSAPLLSSADASLLVLLTHVTLMVVRPGTTTSSQMSKAVSLLNEESLFGVILNRVP
ncbi:MAG TPA: CpsD/CapB family tyrosine-protein kinase [Blastocatellia bacterium]|nr:CpsD/CapB family tyrosine-protein kinase [Blastocatellia bacterium]